MASDPEPVPKGCTLPAAAVVDQLGDWDRLRRHATRVETIESGAVLVFSRSQADRVIDLAGREARCCSFLHLDVTQRGGQVRLEITSQIDEGGPVIARLAGIDHEL